MTSRNQQPASPARRRFMEVSARYGFTTAVLAATGGYLWSDTAVAQTAADEESRARNAQHRMILATEYKLGSFVSYPIMQEAFKENAQNLSKGALYVKLFPAGQLGEATLSFESAGRVVLTVSSPGGAVAQIT